MADWAVMILLVVAGLVPGLLATAVLIGPSRRFDGDRLDRLFSGLALGLGIAGWFALIMAEIGGFNFIPLTIIWFALVVSLAALAYRRYRSTEFGLAIEYRTRPRSPLPWLAFLPRWSEYVFLLVWVIVSTWLFFRPHQYLLGGADAGVYVNLAANISNSGSILIEDQTLAELDPDLHPALLRALPERDAGTAVAPFYILPGFYVTDAEAGKIMPQFYPLHPTWQAIAYKLGGVEPALLMSGLWALMGGLAVYLTMREIAGWEAAALGLSGLTLAALQVWFARYPTTETMAQFLLWTGIWSTLLWLRDRRPRALWSLLAGIAFGSLLLVRIDTYFLTAVPIFAWIYLRLSGRWRRDDWWFFLSFGLLAAHSLIHARWQSTPYFYNTFSYGIDLLRRNWLIPLSVLIIAAAALILLSRYRQKLSKAGRYRRQITLVVIIFIILLVAYGWFIRPLSADPTATGGYWYGGGQIPSNLDPENLVRLIWYLSPLTIVLATAGICLMVWYLEPGTAVLVGIGLLFSLIYLWRIQANPHQVYAMRRYVPAVLPYIVVSIAYLLGWLLHRKRLWLSVSGLLLSLAWLALLAWNARGFVSHVDYQGLGAQIARLNDHFEPNSVLIFEDINPITTGDIIGTPLRFLYGHDVYSLRLNSDALPDTFSETILKWENQGRHVYWIGDAGSLSELGFDSAESVAFTISVEQLEQTYERKPDRITTLGWRLTITPVEIE